MQRRSLWRSGTTLAAAAVLVVTGVMPAAADEPAPGGSTTPPTTVVDPPPTTTTVAPTPPSSTTTSSTTTSTTVPGTTLPPVDESLYDPDANGFSSLPAPIIPSAEEDPLFHAALTVDADLVEVSKAKEAYLKQIAETRKVADRAGDIRRTYEAASAVDDEAGEHLEAARGLLQAAALHAYTGYGSSEKAADADVEFGETVKPYRTYVRFTMTDAKRHVADAEAAKADTATSAAAARERHEAAQADLRAARADERAAERRVTEAEEKLDRDRAVLRLQIAALPGMAPGTLDELPDDVELPEGSIRVESPVGTIVVPGSVDPRTATALNFIVAQIGKPYLWGGTGPHAYDCSGLMLRGFQTAGVTSMPRVSQGQQVWATPVDAEDAQPGDLVFFGTPAYHVGVYIGGGLMINAPYTGARIRVDRIWPSVSGYGRVVWS